MSEAADALAGRWRRLNAGLDEVSRALTSQGHEMFDAVARVLNPMYELWEAWKAATRLSNNNQEVFVRGNTGGETTAALMYARGAKTHSLIEFGVLRGFGLGPYGEGPYGASGWYWQAYEPSSADWA